MQQIKDILKSEKEQKRKVSHSLFNKDDYNIQKKRSPETNINTCRVSDLNKQNLDV